MGCKARAQVRVDVRDDGSGSLLAAVVLDREALALLRGPLDEQLVVDDLRRAGWHIAFGRSGGGGAEVKATREFVGSAGLATAVRELAGSAGPLGASLEVERGALRSRYRLRMTAKLDTSAVGVRGDEQLAQVLRDAGLDLGEIEGALAKRVRDGLELRLVANVPGAGTVERKVEQGGATQLSVISAPWEWERLAFGALAASLLASGLLILAVGRRGRRASHSG